MVDTRDLKSLGPKRPCGFDSRPRHKVSLFESPKFGHICTTFWEKLINSNLSHSFQNKFKITVEITELLYIKPSSVFMPDNPQVIG